MLHSYTTENDFRQAMCQWTDDYTTDRQYGDGRWSRLSKKATQLTDSWDITEEWDELSPDDIVTISETH